MTGFAPFVAMCVALAGRQNSAMAVDAALTLEDPVEMSLDFSERVQCSKALNDLLHCTDILGRSISVEVDEPGEYVVLAKSVECDTYLIARDGSGAILSENDDNQHSTDSSVTIMLTEQSVKGKLPITIQVISADDTPGSVTLVLNRVENKQDNATTPELIRQEALRRKRKINTRFVFGSIERGRSLRTLSRSLVRAGRGEEAINALCESAELVCPDRGATIAEHLVTLHELANIAAAFNRRDVATRSWERIVSCAGYMSHLGADRSIESLANLAHSYLLQGMPGECIRVASIGIHLLEELSCDSRRIKTVFVLLLGQALVISSRSADCVNLLQDNDVTFSDADAAWEEFPQEVLGICALRATALYNTSQVDLAVETLRCAIQRARSRFGDQSVEVLSLSNRLGTVLLSEECLPNAMEVCATAYSSSDYAVPKDHLERLIATSNLLSCVITAGDVQRSTKLLDEASALMATCNAAPFHRANVGLSVATAMRTCGRIAQAISLTECLLRLVATPGSERLELVIELRLLLANLLADIGHGSEASAMARNIVEAISSASAAPDEVRLSIIARIGDLLSRTGNGGEARELVDGALQSVAAIGSGVCEASDKLLLSLAVVFVRLGDSHRALDVLRRALDSASRRESRVGLISQLSILERLAVLCLEHGTLREAATYASNGVKVCAQLFGEDSPRVIGLLAVSADIHCALGDERRAQDCADQAVKLLDSVVKCSSYPHVAVWMSVARVFSLKRNWPGVRSAIGNIVNSTSLLEELDTSTVLSASALLGASGDRDAAWTIAVVAWELTLARANSESRQLTEYELTCIASGLRLCVGRLVSLALASQHRSEIDYSVSALRVWKGWVRRVIRGRYLASRSVRHEAVGGENIGGLLQGLTNVLLGVVSNGGLNNGGQECYSIARRRRVIEREAGSLLTGCNFNSLVSAGAPNCRSGDLVFIEFVVIEADCCRAGQGAYSDANKLPCQGRVIASVCSDEANGAVLVDVGECCEVRDVIREYVGRVAASEISCVVGEAAGECGVDVECRVRSLLWDPIAEHLDGVSTLCISPDGFLGAFPFECIVDKDGKYLIEKYSIVYGIEVGEFESGGNGIDPNAGGLIVGGVDRPLGADGQAPRSVLGGGNVWPPLKWAEEECSRIAGLFASGSNRRSTTILRGSEATESRVRESLPGASIVHFATHGFFPRSDSIPWLGASLRGQRSGSFLFSGIEDLAREYPGLLSGLVLAEDRGASSEEARDDGLLTAEEVSWLDLSKCELVVLSACGSGLGEARGGEGLIGLRRAFRMAGAKTVISSLWPISDRATAELMEMFYRNLLTRGLGRGEALRAAQLSMIQSNRAKYQGNALPTTWAAFVLDGDWK